MDAMDAMDAQGRGREGSQADESSVLKNDLFTLRRAALVG
jgi:hypothetical protein